MKKIFWGLSLLLGACKNDVSSIEVIEEKPKLAFTPKFANINENLSKLYEESWDRLNKRGSSQTTNGIVRGTYIVSRQLKEFLDRQEKMENAISKYNTFPYSCLKNKAKKTPEKDQEVIMEAKKTWLYYNISYIEFEQALEIFNQKLEKQSIDNLSKISSTHYLNFNEHQIASLSREVKKWDDLFKPFRQLQFGFTFRGELYEYCNKS